MTDAEIRTGVTKVVQEILEKNGSVTSSGLVASARPKTSPAHAGFTWDDKKAAEGYRLNEARRWIRVVMVKTDSESQERLVHIPVSRASDQDGDETREGEYKPLSVVVESPDEYMRARDEVMSKGRAFAAALRDLDVAAAKRGKADLAAVISQISRGLDLFEQAIETLH